MDFRDHSLAELVARVQRRDVRAEELVDVALARIEALEPALNAWASLDGDLARRDARELDECLDKGDPVGALAGIPIGVKDLEAAKGFRTGYGSALHADDPPADVDSPLVARLRAAGCIVVGKTTTPEHGWQGDTVSPHWGATRNPWNLERSPGGSSGGSAAALVSGMVPLATGSDGGGSIRIPAALCGLSGIKVTNGKIPLGGPNPPGAGFLAVRGPMARRIADVAYALTVCVGPDPTDCFSVPAGGVDWTSLEAPPPNRVVWCPAPGFPVDSEVARVCVGAIERLEAAGTEVIPVDDLFRSPPLLDWYTLWTVFRDRAQGDLRETPDWERIDPGLREEMEYARAKVDAVTFARALDAIHTHNLELVAYFEQAPLILCPTVAGRTGLSGQRGTIDGEETESWAPFTQAFNMTRHPAGSVCAGFTSDGLPVGLQVVGQRHDDLTVLRAIATLEEIIGDERRPSV